MKITLEKKEENDKKEEYISYLINQFLASTNNSSLPQSIGFQKSFLEWSKERKKSSITYKELLEQLKISLDQKTVAEIGKGINDTLVYNNNATVITPYPYNMYGNKKAKNKVIKTEFRIDEDGYDTFFSPLLYIDTLITQNPYDEYSINNWHYLFDKTDYKIVLGIYGKVYDKDKEEKIKLLKNIKNKITTDIQEESIERNDNYGYLITNILTKKKR